MTRNLDSLRWDIGENETTSPSFIWRKYPSTDSWERYSATILAVPAS
ncbi:MAG: hypothetical protein ACYDEY_09475 [Acidimicrobiales bacterium]